MSGSSAASMDQHEKQFLSKSDDTHSIFESNEGNISVNTCTILDFQNSADTFVYLLALVWSRLKHLIDKWHTQMTNNTHVYRFTKTYISFFLFVFRCWCLLCCCTFRLHLLLRLLLKRKKY